MEVSREFPEWRPSAILHLRKLERAAIPAEIFVIWRKKKNTERTTPIISRASKTVSFRTVCLPFPRHYPFFLPRNVVQVDFKTYMYSKPIYICIYTHVCIYKPDVLDRNVSCHQL